MQRTPSFSFLAARHSGPATALSLDDRISHGEPMSLSFDLRKWIVAINADFETEMFCGNSLSFSWVFSSIVKSFPLYRSGVLNLWPTATLRHTASVILRQKSHIVSPALLSKISFV